MNTVKDFRDLGLEFVGDDMVDCSSTSKPDFENIKGYELNVNTPEFGWDEQIVGAFAWRENTGKAPEFKGEIEVKHRDGCVLTEPVYMESWDTTGDIGDIIEWRPLLIQPSAQPEAQESQQEKPIYTQEMADAKALVPVGAEFRVIGDENCEDGYCLMRCVGRHVDGGLIAEYGSDKLTTVQDSECLPLKSQRDIEIESITDLCIDLHGSVGVADVTRLHKAGYRVTKVEE